MCYQDVVVPKELLISLAEPAYGIIRTLLEMSARKQRTRHSCRIADHYLVSKEIRDSMINQMRLYDVKFNHCSKAGSNSPHSLQFVIHRAFADEQPNRCIKTGVGVQCEDFREGKLMQFGSPEYVLGNRSRFG